MTILGIGIGGGVGGEEEGEGGGQGRGRIHILVLHPDLIRLRPARHVLVPTRIPIRNLSLIRLLGIIIIVIIDKGGGIECSIHKRVITSIMVGMGAIRWFDRVLRARRLFSPLLLTRLSYQLMEAWVDMWLYPLKARL